ncbi:hypothetical protein Scep_028759 [Stephania cephalantha]|uniref:Uncharacterized protein n=1 Tax=Stephania cephalantha TaxID=152367 RepID=A0AAP0EDQ3_9MAGN
MSFDMLSSRIPIGDLETIRCHMTHEVRMYRSGLRQHDRCLDFEAIVDTGDARREMRCIYGHDLSPQRFEPTPGGLRVLSPFPKSVPITGPLLLLSPPWQLSQSATPLYSHGELVMRKAGSFSSGFLQKGLRLGAGKLAKRVDEKELVKGDDDDDDDDDDERFLNLPNWISLGRLVSGPVIGWMIVNEWYLASFMALAVSGATDWLDGYTARKMGINSVVGSYLDPLADKVLIGSVAVAMVEQDLLPSWLVGLVLFRDVGLISGAVLKRASSLNWQWKSWSEFVNLNRTQPQKVEPLFISKASCIFELALVAAALLQPEFGTEETQIYITYLSWLVASTTAATTIAYGAQYMRSSGAILASRGSIPRTKSS